MRPIPLLLAVLMLAVPAAALAQAWPAKPIRFVSAYPPGGPTDILARVIAAKLQPALGHPVIVENRAGAGGNVGTDYVAKQPGDGYTILMAASGPLAINPSLYKTLPFDPERDLVPIILVARLNATIGEALESEDLSGKLRELGSTRVHGSPADFAGFIRAEASKWSKIVARSGAQVD